MLFRMKRSNLKKISFLLISYLFLTSSCEGGYILKQAAGQVKLLLKRVPFEKIYSDNKIGEETKLKLRTIEDILFFARDNILLDVGDSYRTFVKIDEENVVYALTCAKKTELAPYVWKFPFVGRINYKGFFSLADAKSERDKFEKLGYDTYLRPVAAYSTLGWFDDPVLSTMLDYSISDLANLLIHELTHRTVYQKGESTFNENLATFVGNKGSEEYLISRYGKDSKEYQEMVNSNNDTKLFSEYMKEVESILNNLYKSEVSDEEKLSKRENLFSECKNLLKTKYIEQFKEKNYGRLLDKKFNNAMVISYTTYVEDLSSFYKKHEELGNDLKKTVSYFKDIAKKKIKFP